MRTPPLFRDGDPVDAAEAFVRHALSGGEWEGRDNYPDDNRKTWVERGVGEECERFIEAPLDDYESARIEELLAVARAYRGALEQIAEQQQRTLGWMQKHDIVFDGTLGTDPKNFQHVAFSVYTDLCEVDSWARAALSEAE